MDDDDDGAPPPPPPPPPRPPSSRQIKETMAAAARGALVTRATDTLHAPRDGAGGAARYWVAEPERDGLFSNHIVAEDHAGWRSTDPTAGARAADAWRPTAKH